MQLHTVASVTYTDAATSCKHNNGVVQTDCRYVLAGVPDSHSVPRQAAEEREPLGGIPTL